MPDSLSCTINQRYPARKHAEQIPFVCLTVLQQLKRIFLTNDAGALCALPWLKSLVYMYIQSSIHSFGRSASVI